LIYTGNTGKIQKTLQKPCKTNAARSKHMRFYNVLEEVSYAHQGCT